MKIIKDLAISETGFVFNPVSGESFKLNETGVFIINLLKQEKTFTEVSESLAAEYKISKSEAERDLTDFINMLKFYKLTDEQL